MKYIKKYKLYESVDTIEMKCQAFGIKDYVINPETLLVDVKGDVRIEVTTENMTELPVQFGTVDGFFNASYLGLETLKGIPRTIKGACLIHHNNLTSLDYIPESIGGIFRIDYNDISFVDNNVNCKILHCDYNRNLTYINPNIIIGDCTATPLKNLLNIINEFFKKYEPKLLLDMNRFMERVEEFDIILNNNEVDILNFEKLFDFYEMPFDAEYLRINIPHQYRVIK